ncbi:hypothetical protein PFICI_02067 [Pestalotiopsis fici W106-1]|uniref:Uncharacterized protein n=1 Tax=Pestalotiopsis fici (strain W106-1 / CGMCC3.15140) TaxID=1229662 RepID=W3XQH9_PESFW|nr:uncharacterized protein PFICI_02067 [Pestalotiopsis fici W106-1]ETS88239.1 hypothetical protein PFICI_02067 [Pestalotiopsis fici W106-1]
MQRHWQGQSSNPLSAIPEQTCVLGDFERDELPGLHPAVQQEFSRLEEESKQDLMKMTVWRDYARWKNSWLANIHYQLDASKTQEQCLADERYWRDDFEKNPQQYPALHPMAQAVYNDTGEETKCSPEYGPVLRGYVVAYNNMLKCFYTQPQPAGLQGNDDDKGKQVERLPEMSEVVPIYPRWQR